MATLSVYVIGGWWVVFKGGRQGVRGKSKEDVQTRRTDRQGRGRVGGVSKR